MKNWNKKRMMASILAAFLAGLMIFSVLSGLFSVSASAASQSSVNSLKNRLNEIEKKKDSIENELKGIKNDKKTINERKAALDAQIEVAEEEIGATNELITEYSGLIEIKEKELSKKEEEESAQYELFKKRVRAMYENGETGYLGILLSTDNFSDMLSRFEIISQIVDYDKKLIQEIRDNIAQIEEEKASLSSDKEEQETLKASLVEKSASLKAKYDESEKMMRELEQNEEKYKQDIAEIEKEEDKIQKQIEAELAKLSKGTTYVGGDFLWPCPGYSEITSSFGWRYHPILHVNKLHTGTDIGAPTGAKAVAANTGTVVTSEYNTAYGNYVIVDHGGGKATLYAHLSKRSVSKGDKVQKGQQIGLVGSTGYATGPHLHFEIRINGSPVDPMSYFKKS